MNAPQTLFGVEANAATKQKYAQLTGKEIEGAGPAKEIERKPIEGDCPIWYQSFFFFFSQKLIC